MHASAPESRMSLPMRVPEAPRGLPLLSDPEVVAALERLTRAALEELAGEFSPVLERARSLAEEAALIPVTTEDEHDFLRTWLASEVDATERRAKEIVDPYSGFAHRVHRAFTALRGLVTDETSRARATAKPKILAWAAELDRRRREAEERARREREEAERLAVVARAPYLLHVAVAQVAELEDTEREKREAAERARAAGDHEIADAITDEIGKVEAPIIQPEPPPPPSITVAAPVAVPSAPKGIAKNWKARLRDPDGLLRVVRFVAEHPEQIGLLELNQGAADKLAKVHEARLGDVVPGLEGWNDPTVRRTRGR
jgi:hypothetical protein